MSGYASSARKLHLLGAYWGFPLLSLHLGLHWNMLTGMAGKALKRLKITGIGVAALRIAAVLIALYGAAAFLRYDLFSYMTLQNQFVFFDYEQSAWSFFCDYLAIMGLWIFAAHHMAELARHHTGFCKNGGAIAGDAVQPQENRTLEKRLCCEAASCTRQAEPAPSQSKRGPSLSLLRAEEFRSKDMGSESSVHSLFS